MRILIDNDILIKGACYGLLPTFTTGGPGDTRKAGILGAARFVVPKAISGKQLKSRTITQAQQDFQSFLAENITVEPTSDEQALAAKLEAIAQALALNLDVGESQLLAVLIARLVPLLLTGDKRAIIAMERLLDTGPDLASIQGKIRCLEQIVWSLIEIGLQETIRKAICAEPAIDKALAICFSCTQVDATRETIGEGLRSYIRAIRSDARRVLST